MSTCPSCGGAFESQTIAGVAVDGCAQCRGLWMRRGEFDSITGRPLEQMLAESAATHAQCSHCHAQIGFGSACSECGQEAALGCPVSRHVLHCAIVDADDHEFEVGRCDDCGGVWVSAREVEFLRGAPGREIAFRPKGGVPYGPVLSVIREFCWRMGHEGHHPFWEWGWANPGALLVMVLFVIGMFSGAWFMITVASAF